MTASPTLAAAAVPTLVACQWPRARAVEALRALASAAGFGPATPALPHAPSDSVPFVLPGAPSPVDGGHGTNEELTTALVHASGAMGLDLDPTDVPAAAPLATLRGGAPLLLALPGGAGVLAVLRVGPKTTKLLSARGQVQVPTDALEDALWSAVESPGGGGSAAGGDADGAGGSQAAGGPDTGAGGPPANLNGIASIPARRRLLAARVLRAPGLAGRPLAEAWIVRPMFSHGGELLRGAHLVPRLVGIVAAYLAQFALFVAIWRQVGGRAFDSGAPDAPAGDWGRAGFMALLAAWVVVQLAASAAVSRLALDVGAAVRAGLMRGAMRLDRDSIRAAGVGQLLGRALDADVLDALALGGGVETVAGSFQIALGAALLAIGASPLWSLLGLGIVLVMLGAGARRQARRLSVWSRTRRALTHDLVERMIGHRTALIQDLPTARADADEAALRAYDGETRALDRAETWLTVGLPRAWLLVGLAALVPAVSEPGAGRPAALAMSIGAIWLLYGAFRRLGDALPMLSLAREAWREIAPLMGAPRATPPASAPAPAQASAPAPAGRAAAASGPPAPPLLELAQVAYRYPARPGLVLDGVNLAIAAGERLLLEGASGGGKSTLAALLTGLKLPTTGVLRLRGEPQSSMDIERWRRSVAGAPQFHDNHVLGGDLLFNLLMGRRWPPRLEDVAEAERVCTDLGLGPLLARMPAGLSQLVGETGWQLSHGERSRLFIARSLLQVLDARVLDESFASLDPRTLDEVLTAVLARPSALIVIAHP